VTGIILPRGLICGYFDCSVFGDLKQSPLRERTLFEIEYFLEDGRITYSDGIAYPIRRGYVRIGSPGEHSYSLLPFKTKYVKFMAEGRLADMLCALPRYFRSHSPYETEKMLDDIISLSSNSDNDVLLAGRLMTFIAHVIEDSKNSLISGGHDAINAAKEYMDAHIDEPITLSSVAEAVNLSPNYLHTLFKTATGVTPRDFLTNRRLALCSELLRTTSLPLSEIAERCGFCNQQYMSLLFKKSLGTTPISYRKQTSRDYLV
jgi:AraC-like DNA-binding protein